MGFNAGSVIEPLDYDFSNIKGGPPGLKGVKGTIAEPSDQMIGEFLDAQRALFDKAAEQFKAVRDLGDDPDASAVMAALADLRGEDVVNLMTDTAGLYAELCGGTPSQADILLLPNRARIAFYGWLNEQVVRPEAVTSGGNAQVINLSTAQRG